MKKRVARFIGALLAASMLISTFGTAALAEEETPVSEVQGTDAADDVLSGLDDIFNQATTTPEPTPEPTPAPDPSAAFDNDSYYEEAMGLLAALGVFSGYEDGSMKPGNTITRAEMATVILNMLNVKDYAGYDNAFTDVAAGDWHANIVQTAVNMQIVNGMGDGTFAPNAPVTYAQAVKMVVCALGYGEYAEYRGGWPQGYLNAASRVNITKNASGAADDAAPRGLVAKLVYNTLLADYPQFNGFEGDENGNTVPVYRTVKDETLAYIKYNLRKLDGVVEVTSGASMVYSELMPEGTVVISGEQCRDATGKLDSLIAHRTTAYYTEDELNRKTVIYAVEHSKNSSLKIDAKNFGNFTISGNEITGVTYYPNGKSSSSRSVTKFSSPIIVYNSQYLSAADTGAQSLRDFITPKVGSVTLLDNDNDGSYDVVFVEKYETLTVASATAKRVTGRINGVDNVVIDVDENVDGRVVRVTKGGSEARTRNLNENDVVSVKRSASSAGNEVIEFVATGESVSGAAASVEMNESEEYVAVINGDEYIVDTNAVDDVSLGAQATFHLDAFGRIGYVSGAGSNLSGNESYGWIMRMYTSDDDNRTVIKMYTEGGVKELKLADNVNYWAPTAASASSESGLDSDTWLNVRFAKAGDYEIRLCKFTLNSNGEIRKLYVATSNQALKDTNAVVFDSSVHNNVSSSGNLADGYLMNADGIVEFVVPNKVENYFDESLYSYGTAQSSRYLNREGNGIIFIAADVDDRVPGVVMRINEYASNEANADVKNDGYTSADHSTFMLTKINETINSDDERIFKLTGYSGGSEVTFTTTNVTSVYSLQAGASVYNNRQYNVGSPLWTAIDNDTDDFYSAVSLGDVFTYSSNGSEILCMTKLVDVNYLIENRSNIFNGVGSMSESRDYLMFNPVQQTYYGSEAIVETSNWDISFGSDKMMDACVIKVNASGEATGDAPTFSKDEPYDIYDLDKYVDNGDGTGEGDFIFVRTFKGGMREIYVYRFTTDD